MEFLRNVSAIASHMVKSFYKKATKSFEDSVIASVLLVTAVFPLVLLWVTLSPSTALFSSLLIIFAGAILPLCFVLNFLPEWVSFINDLGRELRNLPPKELDNR